MRIIEKTVYRFDELNDEAQTRAKYWFDSNYQYPWFDDSFNSIKAFCDEFGVRINNYSLSDYYSSVDCEYFNSHFRGLKLKDFKRDHMPTGYCIDCALFESFYDHFKLTSSAKKAFDFAIDKAIKEIELDIRYCYSDEHIKDFFECNYFEFNEFGCLE